jgi:hypothetical protein
VNRLKSFKPSPAMVVAFVALLAALSGTAIALPGRNTVDSGDLRRGAVKNPDLARNAVTGAKTRNSSLSGPDLRNGGVGSADVADDGLTGTDINESSLGAVPNATNAGRAGSAANVDSLAVGKLVKAEIGQTQTVLTRGPLTIEVVCGDADTDTNPDVTVRFKTAQDNSSVGLLTSPLDPDLDTGENADFPALTDVAAATYFGGIPFSLLTPDGTVIAGNFAVAAKGAAGATCGMAAFATS